MIHRQNWLDVKRYLKFQADVKQVSGTTVAAQWGRLRHLLEWADETLFTGVMRKRPTFPAYLESRENGRGALLSAAHLDGIFKTCRAFYEWARSEYPARYKRLEQNWIQGLRPSRGRSEAAVLRERQLYTLDEVLQLVNAPAGTTAQRRMRAAVAFLFLSGMRIGAFVTLPIRAVDLERFEVIQAPALGVRTKNSKAARTYLVGVADLVKIVREWDTEIRSALPPGAYWYAHLNRFGELTAERPLGSRENVRHNFRDDLVELCQRAGVEYLSPHKLRHGFAVYCLKRAKTVAQMKAVSQNLMHANMGITDGIYGQLVNDDVRDIITGLGG